MSGRPTVAVDLRCLVGTRTGIGYYTEQLLAAAIPAGRHRWLGLAHAAPDAAALEELGLRVEVARAPLGLIWQQAILPRRLAAGDVDLFFSPLFTLPRRPGVPTVATVHDLTPSLMPELHRWKTRWSLRPFLARSLRTADRILVDSRSSADDLRRLFPGEAAKARIVFPPVDPAFRPAPREAIESVRAELGCPDGYFLFAGTLEPRKNLSLLLDARQALGETLPLLLAGPYGWRSRAVLDRVRDLAESGVRHLGRLPRERLVRVFQAASCFVYPSLYEGFGLPPAEAMACGVPVIVSDRASLPEVVGDAGRIVDAADPRPLTAAMRELAERPALREELGRRGRERVRRFAPARSAERFLAVVDELLARPALR